MKHFFFCNNSELLTTNRFWWSSPYKGDGYIRYGGFILSALQAIKETFSDHFGPLDEYRIA
jgi:hypothetical protein